MSEKRASLGLPIGANVGRYRVRQVHAEWGFYLTYLAEETETNRLVLLHELLPEELVQRAADGTLSGMTAHTQESMAWARDRFLDEGRALAACAHPAIQKILEVFEAYGTAYWVTPAEAGRSFKQWLLDLGHLPTEAELRPVLDALLPALAKVHTAGLLHLNLKPETIRMSATGQPFLVHFAGSRQAIAQHSHAASAVTTGYSPIEQYDPARTEGPWTDIYGLAAVLHRAVTGKAPSEATLRTGSDPYQKLAGRLPGAYSAQFLSAIDAALAPDPTARPQNIEGWSRMLGKAGEKKAQPFVQRHPRRAAAGATAAAVLLGVVLWRVFYPTPVPIPPKDDPARKERDRQAEIAKEKEKAEEEKKKLDEQKKAEEARLAELQKKMEEQKKAEQERQAAEAAAQEKAAIEKQAEDAAAKKAEEAKATEQNAEAEKATADQAAKKAQEVKGAEKKKAAEKEVAATAEKARDAQDKADKAALEQAAADVIAKKAGTERAAAEKAAAEKAVAQKSVEEQIARAKVEQKAAAQKAAAEQAAQKVRDEKTAAEKAVEQKAAEEKAAAERLAAAIASLKEKETKAKPHEKSEMEKAAEEIVPNKPAEEKAEEEKAAAEKKAAEEKAAAEKAAADKAAAEMAAKKVAEEKAAAEKAAAEKAAAEKAAAEKAAAEKAAKNSGGPPPPSGGGGGEVGSGLGGVWETTQKNANGQPLRKLVIYPDSRYELSGDVSDTGVINAKLGIIGMNSQRANAGLTSTFKYKSMSVIETDGALGKFEWERTSPEAPQQNQEPKK